jgi:hypothetical protein
VRIVIAEFMDAAAEGVEIADPLLTDLRALAP